MGTMTKNDYVTLYPKLTKVKFASRFVTSEGLLKYVTPEGNIISKGSSLRLCRYMRISNVGEILNGKVRFDSPTRWNDPFEKLFYQEPVIIGEEKHYVACLCFMYDVNRGEESMWNVHACTGSGTIPTSDVVVRATLDIKELCERLSKSNPNVRFYLAPVNYSFSRSEILKRWKSTKDKSYSNIEEFIDDMLLKRNAFSYENEIRLFSVSKHQYKTDGSFRILGLNNGKNVIKSVTLPPLPIKNPEKYNQKEYKEQLDQEGLKLKQELHKQNYNSRILQSRLYDVESKIENIVTITNNNKQD